MIVRFSAHSGQILREVEKRKGGRGWHYDESDGL